MGWPEKSTRLSQDCAARPGCREAFPRARAFFDEIVARPVGPHVRQIGRRVGDVLAQHVNDLVAGIGGQVVGLLERPRRGKQAEMFRATGQKPVEQHFVDPLR